MDFAKPDRKIKEKALEIARAVSKKKASDIVILDVGECGGICDYFIICSGESQAQVKAILGGVAELSKKNEIKINHIEQDKDSRWILADFFDIVLHIFLQEARDFYNLEYLWKSAKRVDLRNMDNENNFPPAAL